MLKNWKITPSSILAGKMALHSGVSELTAQILLNRGISDVDSIKSFLDPRLSSLINPMLLKDMDKAVDLVLAAIDRREGITVCGDYDADGITGTAVLLKFFSSIGVPVSSYIPNRLEEGYGLNSEAVRKIARNKTRLIITVDCGISNMDEVKIAHGLGMEVIVTDHHQIPEDFNPICPTINPLRADSEFPFRQLAGVGVAFFLAVAIRSAMRERGWFVRDPEPDLRSFLDLVAIGTIADMVPLVDQNRIIVKAGIKAMKHTKWPGVEAIKQVSKIDSSGTTSNDLAYKIGPRLNAAGRMGNPLIGLNMLLAGDDSTAFEMAETLNRLNSRRQAIEKEIFEQIDETMISKIDISKRRTLVFWKNGWHKGVLGIVASRLLEKYHRPALILTVADGVATGSGRSIDGFDLYKALSKQRHLLERYGGHYHAAGLTLKESNIPNFVSGLEEIAREELSDKDLMPVIHADADVSLGDITFDQVNEIKMLGPFGSGNPEPVFYAARIEVLQSWLIAERHLKMRLRQGGNVLDGMGFNLGERYPLDGKEIDILFAPEINSWQGLDRIQLRIVDLELAGKDKTLT
ncbi:MAG: single-stranded-DNA-specific exonuclease RecJ [Deltaproteobacteria bacterium]|nr:single-stranded-DNA-specific exonuclease RecJ [Deltaproteobacteria bacterium]